MPGPVEGIPDDSGGSDGESPLSWVWDLKPLLGVVSTLTTIATNPKEWLRGHVFQLIAEWIVGTILDGVQYILGWAFFAIERTTSIIVDGLGPLTTPFEVVGNAVVSAIELVYSGAEGAANSAGLAGPPAAAFAFALVVTVLAVVVFAVMKVIPVGEAVEGSVEALR